MIAECGRLGKKSAGLVYRPGGVQGYDMFINKFGFFSQEGKP
jgi:hypothetical protein